MPDSDYKIEKSEVLRYLGYRGQKIDAELSALIDRISAECIESAEPKYSYNIFALEETENGLALSGTHVFLRGNDIKAHLAGADSCAIMAATLGFNVERVLIRLGQRSTTEEVIYNAACTALIEAVADRCEAEIVALARSRNKVTNFRYSPGYGDFPLSSQTELLDLIEARVRLGITLTESFLMIPRKSVSAVVGIFPENTETARPKSSCEICENFDTCEFRKAGAVCGR